jgi:hypothetical protein
MINCFLHRQYICGIPILLIHDLTDIFVNLIRIVREIKKWVWLTLPVYALFLLVWITFRNVLFNTDLVYPLFRYELIKSINMGQRNHLIAFCGVFILMGLNTFWLQGMLYSGYLKIFKGKDVYVTEEPDSKNDDK